MPPVNVWGDLAGQSAGLAEPLAPTLARHAKASVYQAEVYTDLARHAKEALKGSGLSRVESPEKNRALIWSNRIIRWMRSSRPCCTESLRRLTGSCSRSFRTGPRSRSRARSKSLSENEDPMTS